jgi:hypothetical protein
MFKSFVATSVWAAQAHFIATPLLNPLDFTAKNPQEH